ncbi:MAG: ABC transporter substrate-binding protein [Alphaproteobacteria bacterium]|nr:ABC transporter substrate-binding protein [Alphaproteobacteria bacterium]
MEALDKLSARQDLSDEVLAARFDVLAARHFDLVTMARATLGADVGAISRPLWPKFVSAYRKHLQTAFVTGMRRHGASTSRVLGNRTAPNGLPVIVTRIKIDGHTRDTVWFMCRQKTARICDIEVDGVRASARQRSVFRPVLMRQGPDAFISQLAAGRFATQGELQP